MMASISSSVLTALSLLLAVPAAVLWLQVRLAARATSRQPSQGRRPSLAIVVPAHDEAEGIGETLTRLRGQLLPGDRLLVVADNCSDDTAERAAACGAEVVVRQDPSRRGKGYALAAGIDALAEAGRVPPDVVLIVDADCRPAPGAVDALAGQCASTGGPVQGLYLMLVPARAGLGARFGAFAWALRNQVRPAGGARAGFPCPLFGSGMAFPYGLLARMPLASGHLVEDLKLGVDLMLAGHTVSFCPHARVESDFPTDMAAMRQQRSRWEHGHLGLMLHAVPRLLAAALRQRRCKPLAMVLDLAVPPVALLLMLQVAIAVLAVILAALGGGVTAAAAALSGLVLLAVAVIDAWRQVGRALLRLDELLLAPRYALRKLNIYARWVTGMQVGWVRTARSPSASSPQPESREK